MFWSVEHRTFCVKAYFENGRSIVRVQRAFRLRFNIAPRGRIPDRNCILSWVNAFETSGNVSTIRRGPQNSVITPENVERVRVAIQQSPRRSIRKQSQVLGISRRSMHRIIKEHLHMHPYKMVVVQELKPRDYEARQIASENILAALPRDAVVFFSDEAHFHLSGCVNKQNMRYWSETNPRELHQRPLHSDRVTVWCALSKNGIIGPYFFEENDRAVSVNSARYLTMIQEFFLHALDEMGVDEDVWFQQDGATAHTARRVMEFLRGRFPGRLISLRGDLDWPARSPDLAPCDFFLWGYLKSKVYNDRPRTIEDLKNNIRANIAEIPVEMLGRVHENFRKRLDQCIQSEGAHMPDTLFKTK
uniref:DUF4817 domain-containing protein n=1 Tax=Photinus pyralis TaxID=7054 RepID=A0A1Y1JZD5_PHOPY